MEVIEPAIIVVKTMILLFGGGITFFAYKAYRRTNGPSFRILSIGFGLITFGAFSGGFAHQIFDVPFDMGVLIHSTLVAIGLGVILASLYIRDI